MELFNTNMGTVQPGKKRGPGRRTRKELGLEPTTTLTTSVEVSCLDACKKGYGSIADALRHAARLKGWKAKAA